MTRSAPAWIMVGVVLVAACNKSNSPTAPSPTPVAPAPTPTAPTITRFNLWGFVKNATTGQNVAGARITLASTAAQTNVTTTANGDGYYIAEGVGVGGPYTVTIDADRHNRFTESGVMLAQDVPRDWRIQPFWTMSGTGNTVFDMPRSVSRVRIRGRWLQRDTSNFIVYISDRLVLNEILRQSLTYEGVHQVPAGSYVVRIENSSQIVWEFIQEQ